MTLRSLIVDDNAYFLEAARDLLERQGMVVVGLASTGEEAVRRAQELRPDVTLVDIDLGEDNGFDVARELAAASGLDGARVVLISIYAESDFADLIEASPAVGFLRKRDLSRTAICDLLGAATADGDRADAR